MAKSMEDKFRARIARIAKRQVGQTACSGETDGKRGFFTSCTGAGGQPELWCSDFARWVWWKAGAINTAPGTDILTAAAGTFVNYGRLHNRPQVGDAVLFAYNQDPKDPVAGHVGIVVQVNGNGTIVSVSGDIGGSGSDANFAKHSRVTLDNAYNSKPKTSDPLAPNSPLSGYVSPVEDDMPYTKKQILKIVQDGVSAELNTKLGTSDITPAQGAKAAVHAHQQLAGLAQQLADLTAYVKQHLPPPPPPPDPAANGGTGRTSSSATGAASTSSGAGPASTDGTGPASASSATGAAASTGARGRRTGTKTRTSPAT